MVLFVSSYDWNKEEIWAIELESSFLSVYFKGRYRKVIRLIAVFLEALRAFCRLNDDAIPEQEEGEREEGNEDKVEAVDIVLDVSGAVGRIEKAVSL